MLSEAAGLAAPLFDPAQLASEPTGELVDGDVLHGLDRSTANVVARRPLMLAIDDLHWCDLASLRWLAYLLPRIEGLDLLVVVCLRPAEPGEDPALVAQIVSDPLATIVQPAPLSSEGAARWLLRDFPPDADDAFCAACRAETGGNPLLLRELVHTIADEGLAPVETSVPELQRLEALAGSRAVSLRLSRLPAQATALARAVAELLGDEADPSLAAALAGLDDETASERCGRAGPGRCPAAAAAARVRPPADPHRRLRDDPADRARLRACGSRNPARRPRAPAARRSP